MKPLSRILQILSVGLDTGVRDAIRDALRGDRAGVELTVVDTAADAVPLLADADCLLSTYPLDDERADALETARQERPDLPVVFVLTDDGIARDAIDAGAAEYVRASVLTEQPALLTTRIRGVVEHQTTAQREATTDVTGPADGILNPGDSKQRIAETIVANFPNGAVTMVDDDLQYRLAGGELFEKLPTDPDDVIGSHVGDVDSGDRDLFVQSYRDALAGEEIAVETIVEGRTLLHRAVPVEDPDGSITSAVGMTQDITEQKQRERELDRNRQFLRDIQAVADVGGWEVDLGSESMRWTDEVYRLLGLPTDYDPTVEDAIAFYHPDDRDTIDRAYDALTSEGEPFDTELRIETTDGNVRWVRARGQPWRDDEGTIVGVRGTVQDITVQKAREQELRQKSRAVEAAPIGVVVTDPNQADNPITYANQEFLDATGYDLVDVLGRNCRFLQGENTDPETVATIREAIEARRAVSVELRNYRQDGTEFWNYLEIAPVRDDDGDLLNFVGFQRDVTERVEYERALERSRNRYQTLIEHFPDGAVALVDEDLRYTAVGGTPINDSEAADIEGTPLQEALSEELAELLVPRYADAFDGETSTFEATFDDTVYRFRIAPVRDDDGSVFAAMGVSQDITELKERQQTLEKRERVLHELHVASRESYPLESADEVSEFVVEFLENAFEFSYVSVKRFDEHDGVLRPAASSGPLSDNAPGPIEPGDNPLWNTYRTGDSVLWDCSEVDETCEFDASKVNQRLAVPIGDFGLIVAFTADDQTFDDADVDLIEVLAMNTRVVFETLQHNRERSELTDTVEEQQETLAELQGVVEAIQAIQRRVANSDSRDELEDSVCSQLVETDHIDFAWIGRPQTSDTDLTATAWAGDQHAYLDTLLNDIDDVTLPAQHAAAKRDPYAVPHISQRVVDEAWAKEALSAQFRSVLSVPLIYDDVLYGVLTVYSSTADAFETAYEHLVSDVGSLVVTYSRILEQGYDTGQDFVEIEFELADTAYPLQRLATATGCRIEYDTVTESLDGTVRVLVTVTEGDPAAVIDWAETTPSVQDVSQFGDSDSRQVRLTVEKPFLALEVANHGGRILEALSADTTTLRIALPNTVSPRPLLDALTNRYQDIDMVAQRQRAHRTETTDSLTDRQYEILNAAYHGGYYETPRNVTGKELAEEFDVSGPAIYNHLQAVHRKLVEQFLDRRRKKG